MQIRTWLHRLTDESNLWFSAIKAEDEGDLFGAARYYMKDTTHWLKQGSLVRAALSCSCAANCFAEAVGDMQSRKLYLQAAAMYIENADAVIGQSIRESLWSLQEGYENLIMAGDEENSIIVYNMYSSLATKISPFSGAEEAMKVLGFRKLTAQSAQKKIKKSVQSAGPTEELNAEIEKFIENTKSAMPKPKTELAADAVLASINNDNGGSKLSEKGIVS